MTISQFIEYGQLLSMPSLYTAASTLYLSTKNGGPLGPEKQPALWHAPSSLWFRDASFVNKTSPNGEPVFWGRGNGWASVMLAHSLSLGALPAGDALRADFEATLKLMAAALLPAQGADGFWRSNVLDAAEFPGPETTGTGAFTYALAAGIRLGLLDAATYTPVVAAAWAGIAKTAINATGAVAYCQAAGAAPGPAPAASTSDFCTGFVLLAGAEVFRLVTGM